MYIQTLVPRMGRAADKDYGKSGRFGFPNCLNVHREFFVSR